MGRLPFFLSLLLAAALLVSTGASARPDVKAYAGKICTKQVKIKGKVVRKKVVCPKPRPKPPAVAPVTPSPPAPGTTRTNPFPLGSAVKVPDWTVAISSVNFDAWPQVQAANMFNDPPAPGWVDIVVSLTMTYTGSSTGNPYAGNELHYVGASNVGYPQEGFDHYCGVSPAPELLDFGDVFPGGTVSGNVCFQVQSTDDTSLVGYWDNFGTSGPGPWFALR